MHGPPPSGRGVEPLPEHERVVVALMAEGPVLPVRYGTTVASEDELRAELRARAAPPSAFAGGDVEAFRAAAGAARCTGPWPPYSFAGGLGSALDRRVDASPRTSSAA